MDAAPPEPCDPDAGAGRPPDTNDDVYGIDGCRPLPARLVVLGDSVADRITQPSKLVTGLRARVPNLVYEKFSVSGSRVSDLPAQARLVAPGAGHVFVFIWSLGNDLLVGGILQPDADLAPLHAAFAEVFDYFSDRGRFPGGATFLLNTYYDPFDNCDAPGARPWRGQATMDRVRYLHEVFFLDVAEARPDTVAIDHYPDFLGHGSNANIKGCPYCGSDNTQWVDGLMHPLAPGVEHVGDKWEVAFSRMLEPSCRG
jgi:hypothetical protein